MPSKTVEEVPGEEFEAIIHCLSKIGKNIRNSKTLVISDNHKEIISEFRRLGCISHYIGFDAVIKRNASDKSVEKFKKSKKATIMFSDPGNINIADYNDGPWLDSIIISGEKSRNLWEDQLDELQIHFFITR